MENLNNGKNKKTALNMPVGDETALIKSEIKTFICVLIASLNFFANGTFVGWSSHAIAFLFDFTPRQNRQIISAIALGAAISPLVIHKIWHRSGTKLCIIIANVLMVASWVLSTFGKGYWTFLVGRGIAGIAIGAVHFLVPIYINDISTPEQKSSFNCVTQMQFVFGILMQFVLGYFENYLLMNVLPAIIPAALFAAFWFMPESPRYLCAKGRENDAKTIIGKFKDIDNQVEYDIRMWSSVKEPTKLTAPFRSDIGLKNLLPIFGIIIFEQLIGAVSILFYLQKILSFTRGEYSSEITAIYLLTIFACSVALPYFVDYCCKLEKCLIWSSICMAISLCLLGVYCHFQGSFGYATTEGYRHVPLYCLGAFYMFYAIGPYRLASKCADAIIPKHHHFTIRCLFASTTWTLIYGITRILPGLIDMIGVGWLFWYMAMMCLLMVTFVNLFVPTVQKLPEELKLVESSESFSDA